MLSTAFFKHGILCASHPWEVVVAVITVIMAMISVTFFGDLSHSKVCGWNYRCPQAEDVQSSEIIILTIARCLAVGYIYLQFRKLGELGSKFSLGLLGLCSIFLSVIFSAGFVHLLGYELYGLGDSLPFFLLVLDLSKVNALARYTVTSVANGEGNIRETVANGVAVLGPQLTLDTVVEVLVIGIGTFSGIPILELICCFGCISLIVNYLVFMTFFPASLCVLLEYNQFNHLGAVARAKKEADSEEENPVVRRVKLIMSIGLAMVHVYSRWIHNEPTGAELDEILRHEESRRFQPSLPLWDFYLRGLFELSPQHIVTYCLIALLGLKYVFIDSPALEKRLANKSRGKKSKHENGSVPKGKQANDSSATLQHKSFASLSSTDDNESIRSPPSSRKPSLTCHRRRTFTVGEDEDEGQSCEVLAAEKFQQKISPAPKLLSSIVSPVSQEKIDVPVTEAAPPTEARSIESLFPMSDKKAGYQALSDAEILQLVKSKQLSAHKLEDELGDHIRAIQIRRMLISASLPDPCALMDVPFKGYDYSFVNGNCCENVLGYMPIPLGVAGPLVLDGKSYQVPLATTEGCLVASINRGCRAITLAGGARTTLKNVGMTRGPVVRLPTVEEVFELDSWITSAEGFEVVRKEFNRTSRFAKLQEVVARPAGNNLFLRFRATTGDAMGMNMLCKGTERALHAVQERFPNMRVVSLSGNYCIDKKPSALNWIEGRGKSVNCEAVIPGDVLRNVLKTSANELEDLNLAKNLIGSSMAGSIGGNNAHAANIVGAIFLATGQDAAQVVGSSMCITRMERHERNPEDLYISCTMPCIEVGTVGGGTNLPPQGASLKMLGIQGSSVERPGANAEALARIICGSVLAGELNLMSALAAGQLVQSHLKHNRSKLDVSRMSTVSLANGGNTCSASTPAF